MSKATGKARHPHDSKRPEPKKVKRALEAQDTEALRLALTPRQRAFAHEYIVDFNATAAAIRAGYATTWADRQAFLLMKHKGIAALIDHLMTSKEAKITAIDPDYVISRVTEIISKEDSKDGDKLRGLELLARHLGMFIDRTELTGKDGGAIAIENQKTQEEAEAFRQQFEFLRERQEAAKKSEATLLEPQ